MPHEDNGEPNATERVSSDLAGPMKLFSIGKSPNFVTLGNIYSGYSLLRFVAWRCDAGDAIMERMCELENLINGTLYSLKSINCKTLKWI